MQDIKTDEFKSASVHDVATELTKVLIEKKGLDIRLFNVDEVNPITSYYLNVTGRSITHVASLADDLVYYAEMRGKDALHTEGRRGAGWILVDFGDIIVNIFDKQSREFYNFDRLISADYEVDVTPLIEDVDKKMKTKTAEE